jgi:outer membrane lipoprotein LolB
VTFGERVAAAFAVALLAGCATVAPPPAAPGETLTGRIAVQIDAYAGAPARALNAAFELQGDAHAGRLDLATPLGTVLAQARWLAGQARLVTPQGTTQFDDLDALTREMLGESLPVAALFDWLRGRPWPGAPSTLATAAGPGFAQLGWDVDLARFDESFVAARRIEPPSMTVRVRLDRP